MECNTVTTDPGSAIRLGVEITVQREVARLIDDSSSGFLGSTFDDVELRNCIRLDGQWDVGALTAICAVKGAVCRALRPSLLLPRLDIHVEIDTADQVTMRWTGAVAAHAASTGIGAPAISISHSDRAIAAVCVAPVSALQSNLQLTTRRSTL